MRRYQIAVVTCVIVWCSTVVYLFRSQDSISISKQNQLELNRAFASLGELKQQNLQLQWTISKMGILNNISTSNDDQKKVLMDLQTELQACLGEKKDSKESLTVSSDPTKEHENLIKRVNNGVVELLYSIETELKHLQKSTGSQGADVGDALSRLSVQQRSILLDIEDLNKENQVWQEKEAKSLRQLVQQRINFVQNPKDCRTAKQLVCQLNKGCGFGCQVHHLAYCFMVAYGTQRTLVIESKNWRYEPGGWEVIFQPVSQTCTKASTGSSISWRGEKETKDAQVVLLPIVDGLPKRPPYLPLGIPEDLAPRLLRLHGNPSVWWVGQFMSYLLRPQKWLQDDLNKVEESFGFKSPVVGIQVRRTDKVGTEAAFHGIEEYMKHVNEWYDKYELRMSRDGTKTSRRVYLATDDSSVLPEAKKKYPEYEFISDQAISESAGLHSRYTKASLRGVVIDIFFLSKCDYLVCTFSSQVCRVAYELMQNLHPDAAAKFHSLDDVYYYGGQTAHDQVAIYDHKARPGSNEIDLKIGDPVGIAGNHWDGYSKGTNRRTNQVGLYPSFKVVETYTLVKYPTYPEADSANPNRAILR